MGGVEGLEEPAMGVVVRGNNVIGRRIWKVNRKLPWR